MSAEQEAQGAGATAAAATAPPIIPSVRLIQDIPVLFADGVMSQSFIPGISKFFLYRADASANVSEPPKNTPVVQIVMPASGFAAMTHFFEHRLKLMIDDGAISQAEVDRIKQFVYENPPRADVSTP